MPVTTSTLLLAVIAVAFVVLVAVFIPTLQQIRKTAKRLEDTLDRFDTDFAPLLKSATETADELQILTASINDKIDQTDVLFNELQEVGHVLLATTHILKDKISPALIHVASLNAGLRAFTRFFTKY